MTDTKTSPSSPTIEGHAHHNYVVGIGASAGGIEALQDFFEHMPQDAGFTFVVILHLSTHHKSRLPEILSQHTALKVVQAEENMALEENVVFVIPHDKNLILYKNSFRLLEKENSDKPNMSIDIFFQSLAEEKGEKSIGIILSGTGTDGVNGIKCIKNAGGIVLVQDPSTAKFDSMPQNAIDSGQADYVLPPDCLRDELLECCKPGAKQRTIVDKLLQEEEAVIFEILDLVKRKTPYDFFHYKRPTILRRIARRMAFLNLTNFSEYLKYLLKHQEEVLTLCKEFLIGVTHFFRDKGAFEELETKVVPNILQQKNFEDTVKIWVAGCSTGEEAYSIAIVFREVFRRMHRELNVKIFASDIDAEAIEFAIKGVYSELIEKDVSKERLSRYFIKEGSRYRIHPEVRKMVIFSHHDILKDVPFGKTDLVSCRNMLIYLDPVLQQKCLSLFHYSLNVGGYLVLGPNENIGELRESFQEINKRWNIYQNLHPSKGIRVDTVHSLIQKHYAVKDHSIKNSKQNAFTDNLLKILLEQTNTAGVYIDSTYQILDTFGKYQDYLRLPEEKLELYLLKMLPKELSIIVGSSIRKAIKSNEKIELKDLKLEGKENSIRILIHPFLSDKTINQNVCLILFSENKDTKPSFANHTSLVLDPSLNLEHFFALEQELKETKEILQRAIEESESSTEELQSSNEELVSANEELQSTNEELQSLNEELHTVNAENALRIKEATELNDDLNNYFRSSDLSQIFLDKNLHIRKFTPAATAQINLIESDIGRSISHISNNIKAGDFLEYVHKVLENAVPYEKEVEMKDGRWCYMKILPYIKSGKSMDGIVITFQDITHLKTLNQQLESLLENQHAILENIADGIVACDEHGTITLFNRASREFHGLTAKPLPPEQWAEYYNYYYPDGSRMALHDIPLYRALKGGKVKDVEMVINQPTGHKKILLANGQQMVSFDGRTLGAVVAMHDITDQKRVEAELRELNNELERKVKERTLELHEKNKSLETINRIGKAITSELDVSTIVQIVTDEATYVTGAQFGAFFYNVEDEKGDSYTLYTISGVPREEFSKFPMPRKTAVFEPTFDGTGIVRVDDITKDPRYGHTAPHFGMPKGHLPVISYLAVPVISRAGKVLGGLFFGHSSPGVFTQQIEDSISAIAAQAAIAMDNAALYATTKAAKEQLSLINRELSEKNEELQSVNFDLDTFVYTASHDLKSPVSNIEGLVNALTEVLREESPSTEEIETYVKMIQESTHRFSQTIKDLTTITKVQKDKEWELEKIHIAELVEEIKLDMRDLIASSEAQIIVEAIDPPIIPFSHKNLKSVLYNLISNGIKYASPNRTPVVQIRTTQYDGCIKLSVLDNGLGLTHSQKEKLFSLFKRFHQHVEGSGIGLYLVKRIIDNAGGRIEVESEPNVGTVFHIFLKI